MSVTVSTQRVDHAGTRSEHWWVERDVTEYTIQALLRRWVKQITEFFDPPSTREIKAPCIQCGEEWAWRTRDGESSPYRVFVFVQDAHRNTLEARCMACGMSWGRDKFMFIAAAIGVTEDAPEH